jgi:hypothetical protein
MKTKKKINRRKYGVGGYIDPLTSNRVVNQPINYIPNPNESLVENDIRVANSLYKTKSNPFTQGMDILGNIGLQVGTSIMGQGNNGIWGDLATKGMTALGGIAQGINSKYATGGLVPINVEGEEVIETPFGNISEFIGNSHEQGGINVNVPQGSEIFSKRVKGSDGNTMAQRKLNREKQLKRLERVYNNNPTNSAIKKAYEKTKKDFELIEQNDILEMEALNQATNKTKSKFKSGGKVTKNAVQNPLSSVEYTVGDYFDNLMNKSLFSNGITPEYASDFQPNSFPIPDRINVEAQSIPKPNVYEVAKDIGSSNVSTNRMPNNKFNWNKLDSTVTNNLPQATFGDILGIAGQVYGYNRLMKNTLEQRATDTPNINPYRDFGKKGLQTIQNSKEYVNQVRDNMLKDMESSIHTLQSRNRNSARGVNTLRALDIASELAASKQRDSIYNNFLSAMSDIYSQEAQQQNAMDNAVMQGEQQRDMLDRQDKDNFYTNLAQDIASKGFGLQNVAKNINNIYERKLKQTALNSLFNDYEVNALTGETKRKALENLVAKNPNLYNNIPKEKSKDFYDKLIKYNLSVLGDKIVDRFNNEYTIEQILNLK